MSWRSQIWPSAIVLLSVLVFIGFWTQTTPLLATVMAVAILLAGIILVTLVSGAAWITQLRRLIAGTRR